MDLAALNVAPASEARADFLDCCGSTAWADEMESLRPFPDVDSLLDAAAEVWWALGSDDWLEAFAAHPRIGERIVDQTRFAEWSRREQADAGDDEVAADLVAGNQAYEERFGHVFLVFATGKTAPEMLENCRGRLGNDPDQELRVCATEQAKITDLRLRRLLGIG